MWNKRKKHCIEKNYACMSDRLFCIQFVDKILQFWYLTLLVNLIPTLFINNIGNSGPVMTFLTWVIFPPLMFVGEIIFLLLGALAEIPAEMISDALFPRLGSKGPDSM